MPMRKPDEEKFGKQTIVRKKQEANGCPVGHETTVRERHETTVRERHETTVRERHETTVRKKA